MRKESQKENEESKDNQISNDNKNMKRSKASLKFNIIIFTL